LLIYPRIRRYNWDVANPDISSLSSFRGSNYYRDIIFEQGGGSVTTDVRWRGRLQYSGSGSSAPSFAWSFGVTPYAGGSLPATNAGLVVTASDTQACDANGRSNGAGALTTAAAPGTTSSSATSASVPSCPCSP
jgi:hypothetical protein